MLAAQDTAQRNTSNPKNTTYELRPYQREAVDAAVDFLSHPASGGGLEILPGGAGKSLIIAGVAAALGEPVLIFQPTKEILEQNLAKMQSYGYDPSVYSASLGRKEVGDITFATIGSAAHSPELFQRFKYLIVDECHHGLDPKGGMFRTFLDRLGKIRLLGLTASPYRLITDGFGGSILKFLTRTRPRIFTDVVYYVQTEALFQAGYLCPVSYVKWEGFDRTKIKLNSTGADFREDSLSEYYRSIDFQNSIAEMTDAILEQRSNVLVFTAFVAEAEYVASRVPNAVAISAKTSKSERERIVTAFRNGEIRAVINSRILVCGFDYPSLEAVLVARPTMSLAVFQQMICRCVRPNPGKEYAGILDMCGNLDIFGRLEHLRIVDGGNGKWHMESRGKQLTNVYYDRL